MNCKENQKVLHRLFGLAAFLKDLLLCFRRFLLDLNRRGNAVRVLLFFKFLEDNWKR